MERITLREASAGDEMMISEFFDSMGGESRALFNRRNYNRNGVLKYCLRPDASRRYFIADEGGVMAGYVFFLDFNTMIPELGIAVRDEYRGMRFGRELMNYAIDYAKKEGCGGIRLTTHVANVRAQALYEALGFCQMGITKNGCEMLYLLTFKREKSV